MDRCVDYLNGTHVFAGFAAKRGDARDEAIIPRTYSDAHIRSYVGNHGGNMHEFTITGDGFLYKQVRGMAGALLAVGWNRASEEQFIAACESDELGSLPCGDIAPAHGLLLSQVHYHQPPNWDVL